MRATSHRTGKGWNHDLLGECDRDARLDEGEMWPVAYALTSLTSSGERRIAELVKKAAG